MVILDKVGEGLANTVDYLVEKNRQMAQLNRLAAIIKTETDMINRAYVALGKQYFAMLQGTAVENDMTQICEVIKFSEERLKKAQARYDYVKVYGVPTAQVDTVDMIRSNDNNDAQTVEEEAKSEEASECEEGADITIAVADEEAKAEKAEQTEENTVEETAEEAAAEETKADEAETDAEETKTDEAETDAEEKAEESLKKKIAEKAAETVNQLKKRRNRRFEKDTEAEND